MIQQNQNRKRFKH